MYFTVLSLDLRAPTLDWKVLDAFSSEASVQSDTVVYWLPISGNLGDTLWGQTEMYKVGESIVVSSSQCEWYIYSVKWNSWSHDLGLCFWVHKLVSGADGEDFSLKDHEIFMAQSLENKDQ